MRCLFKIMLDKLNILLYNNMVVQVGEAAAPCSPQSAIVGTIFSGRVFISVWQADSYGCDGRVPRNGMP